MPHQWFKNIHDKARCPQCGEYEFHRSRARSKWEEFRKEYTQKRPYRCHSCNFRVWIDPVKLNYDYKQSDDAFSVEENPLPVPSFDLGYVGDPVVSDVEVQPPHTVMHFDAKDPVDTPDAKDPVDTPDAKAPVETPDADENNDVWKYHIEFDPNDIREIRPYQTNVDFIPHHRQSRHGRKCPACGRSTLFRSHSKNLAERVRKKMTSRRIYRCHNCNWRGWLS